MEATSIVDVARVFHCITILNVSYDRVNVWYDVV
jgi:hypothetical protein